MQLENRELKKKIWSQVFENSTINSKHKSWKSQLRVESESESEVVSNSLRLVDCSSSGSSVHGILQARILEWVAISFSTDLLFITK